jgi:hypothetical protein
MNRRPGAVCISLATVWEQFEASCHASVLDLLCFTKSSGEQALLSPTLSLICFHIPIKRSPVDTKGIADIRHGKGFISGHVPEHLHLFSRECLRPAAFSSSAPCSGKSCLCPLADNLPLKFSQSAKDMEDELSSGCCGVDVLLQRFKVNSPLIKRSRLR